MRKRSLYSIFVFEKVSKINTFLCSFQVWGGIGQILLPMSFQRCRAEKIHCFQPFSTPFLLLFVRKRGQAIKVTLKLCLQLWIHLRQTLLYWRLPFSPRKKLHSCFHFLLRLTVPVPPFPVFRSQEVFAPHILFSPGRAAPGQRACLSVPPYLFRAPHC